MYIYMYIYIYIKQCRNIWAYLDVEIFCKSFIVTSATSALVVW